MNAQRLFALMSPTTLAGLIADIECLGTGAESADLRVEDAATRILTSLVGEADAARLIQAAVDANYPEEIVS